MERPILAGLGEILWDLLPDGPQFGGAPANFACNVAALAGNQAEVHMVGCVGRDDLGARALDELRRRGVGAACVERLPMSTGQVEVAVDSQGIASYSFVPDTAWESMAWTEAMDDLARRTNAVCFGTLSQRSAPARETVQRFVSTMPEGSLRIFDINLRPPFFSEAVVLESLERANVLKLNEEELPVVARLAGVEVEASGQVLPALAECFGLKAVALTCGGDGAHLWSGGEYVHQGAEPVPVVDTVGAGDSFTAAMALGILRGLPLDLICREACRVAAFVCSHAGASPALPDALTAWLSDPATS